MREWCSASGVRKAVSAIVVCLFLGACGSKESGSWRDRITSCSAVADDQKATFMAPVSSAVKILIDTTFTADERSGIHDMIEKWNQVGQTLQGADFFVEVGADIPSELRTGNFQSCAIEVGTGPESVYLVRETSADHWTTLGFTSRIPGATMRCYENDYLTKQEIVVRPDLVDPTQLTSVILHELGHALGLDHSCKTGGAPGFASCDDLPTPHPYRQAVMYPTLGADTSSATVSGVSLQIKNALQANDTARASCLY